MREAWRFNILQEGRVASDGASTICQWLVPLDDDLRLRAKSGSQILDFTWLRCREKANVIGPGTLANTVDCCDLDPIELGRVQAVKCVSR